MILDLGEISFYSIVLLTVLSSYWVVMSPNLIHSAVSLLFTLFGVAAIKSAYRNTYNPATLNKVNNKETAEWIKFGDITTQYDDNTVSKTIE
jgi:hypothetical protein